MMKSNKLSELIWASPRELLNIFQADEIGCHVITVTPEILSKIKYVGSVNFHWIRLRCFIKIQLMQVLACS